MDVGRLLVPGSSHLITVVLTAGVSLGCHGTSRPPARTSAPAPQGAASPAELLRTYEQAIQRGDARAAYALLDPPTQRELSWERFQRDFQELQPERTAQGQQLTRLLRKGDSPSLSPQEATVRFPQGVQAHLSRPSTHWQVHSPDLHSIRPRSPEEALTLFLEAAERRDLPTLLRLLRPSTRQQLEEEVTERILSLRRAIPSLSSPSLNRQGPAGLNATSPRWERKGDRIRLRYDPRYFIDLQADKEPGSDRETWRVQEFN